MFRNLLTVLILLTLGSALLFSKPTLGTASTPSCHAMAPGQEGSLNGFVPFGPSSLWNQDISQAAVDPNSSAILNFIGGTSPLHPDFGAGEYNGSYMGIPYVVVPSTQPMVEAINYTLYPGESDPAPIPIPGTLHLGLSEPGDRRSPCGASRFWQLLAVRALQRVRGQ